ncbi:MAG: hypothetical protein AAFV29_26950, partial [Myxococcota bacterium]
GRTINFFPGNDSCENTGRLDDVVYHEFGHSLHANAIIRGAGAFDEALSEGASDYFAATITNDSGMGRGFFRTDQPLREIDPPDREARWPDDIASDPHTTGLIFAGAMWDLRKTFVRTFATAAEGVRAADLLLYAALQRARDIPSAYFEILAADDDDGDIANGTPNFCAINEAFGAHGLADPRLSGPPVGAPMLDGLTVSLPRFERQVDCDAADVVDVRVEWRRRAKTELQGTMSATESPQGWSARLPTPPNNSVVQYRVVIDLDDGTALSFPDNAADPWYETYVGPTEDLYCIDFERNPFAEGWRSELVSGEAREGADDWQWGDTNGGESGDPATAFSGTNVLGNDL